MGDDMIELPRRVVEQLVVGHRYIGEDNCCNYCDAEWLERTPEPVHAADCPVRIVLERLREQV